MPHVVTYSAIHRCATIYKCSYAAIGIIVNVIIRIDASKSFIVLDHDFILGRHLHKATRERRSWGGNYLDWSADLFA